MLKPQYTKYSIEVLGVNNIFPEKVIRLALDELLEWDELIRSPQLVDFLKYIVEQKLQNEEVGIKAYAIAVDVFGRPTDFDPQTDPIVRVQGRRLRILLDRFYEEGRNNVPIRICIPLGRYVPEFRSITETTAVTKSVETPGEQDSSSSPEENKMMGDDVELSLHRTGQETHESFEVQLTRVNRKFSWQFLYHSILASLAALVFAAGAIFLSQLLYSGLVGDENAIDSTTPTSPAVSIGTFTNLTGDPLIESSIKGLGLRLLTDLSRFHNIVVHQPLIGFDRSVADEFKLSGNVQRTDFGTEFNILLSRASTGEIVWSTTVMDFMSPHDFPLVVRTISRKVSAALGSYRGPLHRQARVWFMTHLDRPVEPSQYACGMLLNLARDGLGRALSSKAESCFRSLSIENPESPVAIAALARIVAEKIAFVSQAGDNLSGELFEVTQSLRLARDLMPQSSFVHTSLASVLAVQSRLDEARSEFLSAIYLNPSDVDARAQFALTLYFNGDRAVGRSQMELALSDAPAPPPRFYTIRALEALRNGDFSGAISNALIVMRTDSEIGLVLTISAASLAGRVDIVDRFLPVLLSNPQMVSQGALPSLSRRIRDESILRILGYGLLLAGVPSDVISWPFVVNTNGR